MQISIIKKEGSLVDVQVLFSKEEFKQALQTVYKRQASRFSVPGFRKGKAPYAVAMRHYGEGVLFEDALDEVLSTHYKAILDESKVQPIIRPNLDVKSLNLETGIDVVFTFTEKPEVELGSLDQLAAPYPSEKAEDRLVEASLKRKQLQNARSFTVEEGEAKNGDTVNIDFKGFVDGVAFEGGEGKHFDLELGSGNFIPGFEAQVEGHKVGETFTIDVTFPETYGAKELAGKAAQFEIVLHSIQRKELPELDDEFAKDISEFDTLEELRADIRREMDESAKNRAQAVFTDRVISKLVESSKIDLPETLVEEEIGSYIQRQTKAMSYQGITLDQYLGYLGKTMEEFRKEIREQVVTNLKTTLVLEKVVEVLGIELSEEEKKAQLEKDAKQSGTDVEAFEKRLKDSGREEDYFLSLKMKKAGEMLAERAVKLPEEEVKAE